MAEPLPAFDPADCDRIQIPNQWRPRQHQRALWHAMGREGATIKRGVAVWHRRAGKDSTALNLTASKMTERTGTYWHMLPEAAQGRKVVWNESDKYGRRIIDQVFPEQIRETTRNDEMMIRLSGGSVFQVVGSDNYNSLVGANPIGVVFSEYSIANPAAWDFIRPILLENGGWALFIYTPRGKNHGHTLFKMAQAHPDDWFSELLTVDDTHLITPAQIQKERDEGMDDDLIQQEYFCSWSGSTKGAIYGEQLRKARDEGRICPLPYVRTRPVNTFWDIGHSDSTAILCHQHVGPSHRFLRSYENSGQDLAHYVDWLRKTGYLFGKHYLPHDAKNVTLASKSHPLGENIYQQLIGLGIAANDIEIVPRTPDKWTSIAAARMKWNECWFNERPDKEEDGCDKFLAAIALYRKKWSDERQCFEDYPHKDWTSHYADAFAQWSQGYKEQGGLRVFTAPNLPVGRPLLGSQVKTVGNRRVGY